MSRACPCLLPTSQLKYTTRLWIGLQCFITCVSCYFVHSVCAWVYEVRHSPSLFILTIGTVAVLNQARSPGGGGGGGEGASIELPFRSHTRMYIIQLYVHAYITRVYTFTLSKARFPLKVLLRLYCFVQILKCRS